MTSRTYSRPFPPLADPAPRRNERLAGILAEADWSAVRLAREINRTAGPGTIHRSTPHTWLERGSVPERRLAQAAASVLSAALRRTIRPGDIWPTLRARGADETARHPLVDTPWTFPGLRELLPPSAVLDRSDSEHAALLPDPAVAQLIRRYRTSDPHRWTAAIAGRTAPDTSLAAHIESTVPALRALDDIPTPDTARTQLHFVEGQVRAVSQLLRADRSASPVVRRLLVCLGNLAQLGGWMAFELGRHERAQGLFLLGLRAAHTAADRPLAGHILGDLSFQAATFGRTGEAVAYARAADQAVSGAGPLARACVLGRTGYAYATGGDGPALRAARRAAADAFARTDGPAPDAPWAYYLTAQHLSVQAGYSLVALGLRHGDGEGGTAVGRALREGRALLAAAGTEGYGGGPPHPAKSAFEHAWSALGHLGQQDLEAACAAGTSALDHFRALPTARTRRLLQDIRRRLARRTRNPYVRDFLPRLDHALHGGT